jgi:hypothetical protein
MATHAVSGTFSGTGTLTGSPSGIKRKKNVGGPPDSGGGTFTGTATLSLDTSMISFRRNITHTFSGGTATLELNTEQVDIIRSQVWWNKNYTYRRILQVQPNEEGFEIDHPFEATIARLAIRQQKVRPDAADIEVLRLVTFVPEVWEIVPKKVTVFDAYVLVEWPNQVEIPADTIGKDLYYIYYGNQGLVEQPDQVAYEPIEWPVQLHHDDPRITYTRPGEHWESDVAVEDGAKATLRFYGSRIRILANTGPQWGHAIVQIDEGEWETVDLSSPTEIEDQEVYYKDGLSPMSSHYIRYQRSGFKSPMATAFEVNLQQIQYLRHNIVPNIMEEADETLMWGSAIGGVVGK